MRPYIDLPKVSVVTSHGYQTLENPDDERLIDLLRIHEIPWSAVTIYSRKDESGQLMLTSGLDKRLSDFKDVSELLVFFNRNINPFIFTGKRFSSTTTDGNSPSTEYFYQDLVNETASSELILKKLTPEECKEIIAHRIRETIQEHVPKGVNLVVGISGGGDSNALIYGLSQLKDHDIKLHPVILKGIPDWDAGYPRAKELCDRYGLELKVYEESDIKKMLKISTNSISLIDRFELEFQGDDFDFLGTLLIRLALSERARELNARYICTGLNLEDVFCEGIFRTSTGRKPASIPVRTIGDINLVVPLWLCPKRIIDGCFPKYSLENYEARYPCFSLGRNFYYTIVYNIQSQFPGFAEQYVQGLAKQGQQDPVEYKFDQELGFDVEHTIPHSLRKKFMRMLEKTVNPIINGQ